MATLHTAVVAPLARELAPFLRRLEGRRNLRRDGRRWVVGSLAGEPVVAGVLGDGAIRAAAGAQALLDTFPLRRIVLVGVAGALDPALEVGQIVVAARVYRGTTAAPAPDPHLRARAEALGIGAADLLTVPAPVIHPEAKAALRATLPHPPPLRPAVVEMEGALVAEAAGRAGVPYLLLRAISDTATEALPPFLPHCVRADGSIHPGRVALRALLAPRWIPHLLRLSRRVDDCGERLAAITAALLEAPGHL
jgi:adenosylhomocysteine nucleosidase